MISKQLVTLKNDVPLRNDAADFIIKEINKDKLYDFLRDMEFNRLLSQAISFYGEPGSKDFNEKNPVKKNNKINTKTYKTIFKEKQLDELITKLNEMRISYREYLLLQQVLPKIKLINSYNTYRIR